MKPLIAILTCAKYAARADSQRETWVRDVPPSVDLRFFIGGGAAEELGDTVTLAGVPDDYAGLPAKMRAVCAWALERGCTHLFKCDDDVYLRPERLLSSGFERHDYLGRLRGSSGGYPSPYASGFAYWLGSRAMVVIAGAELTEDRSEDRWVANTLANAKIRCHADYRYAVVTSKKNAKSYPEGPRRGNDIIAACEFDTPEAMKQAHTEWLQSLAAAKQAIPHGELSRVCVMIKTFLRDGYLSKALQGVQRTLPECKLVVVDDGRESFFKIETYAKLRSKGHDCIWMDFDSGFGAKANAAIPYCDREYVLIGSDDFDFGLPDVRAGVLKMQAVLDSCPEVGIASGRVDGVPYEHLLDISPDGSVVRELRGYRSEGTTESGVAYKLCDLTVNYSLIRRSLLDSVRWDGGEVKIGGGEHGAFFLDVKKAGYQVAYVPGAGIKQMPLVTHWVDAQYRTYRGRASRPGRPCLAARGIRRWVLVTGVTEETGL